MDNNHYNENKDFVDWDLVWENESSNRKKTTLNALRQRRRKRERRKKILKSVFLWIISLASIYSILVYSQIPFIAKWRTIYIETAMSTMRYQWLATAFIPNNVIGDVMRERYLLDARQADLASQWDGGVGFEPKFTWETDHDYFSRVFHEIDMESFDKYAKSHKAYNSNGKVFIDKADLDDKGTSIRTNNGDQVLAIDEENGILIVKVEGEGYVGRLAIVKDPSQVGLGVSRNFGSYGSTVEQLVKDNDAILGVNASGFQDPEGMGNGGQAYGLVLSDGKLYQDIIESGNRVIAFDNKNRLNIGAYKDLDGFRDAVEFRPALIINRDVLVSGSAGWGIQPRTVIGQSARGEVFLLVIDGRAPGYSIGATLGECANILKKYNAVQACNLDGGSSSVMFYNGREISRPSAANKVHGRTIPNGFLVYPK